ncbi:MAG: MFS transporter [Alphaproteobacteria bacterium]|nr:MFS transporter [Alphaproteobacteria bacterium]
MSLISSAVSSKTLKEHLRSPVGFLILISIAMPIAMSSWVALLNNFVIEKAFFTGVEIGWLHTVREIPGFLTITIIFAILVIKEQRLAVLSLILIGGAVALTGYFPIFSGLLITTFLSSIGFHFFEAVNQSLQLQWLDKKKAPQILGWLLAVGSTTSLITYLIIALGFSYFDLSYQQVYVGSGFMTILLAMVAYLCWPRFPEKHPQNKKIVIKKAYWLYYALQFVAGARRQIFSVFAAFMMVEKFGFEVHELTWLFIINFILNIIFGPIMGWLVARLGERWALTTEYIGLTIVFIAYGGVYMFSWAAWVAATLYVIDHLFFAMAFAQKTYFQKIAEPADLAPTTALAFTINHIAAVTLPAFLGYLWLTSPASVFIFAAGLAIISVFLSLLIPRHPTIGNETIFSSKAVI